jgi:hypothetical protein
MSKRTIVGAAVLLAVALSVPLAVNAQDPPDGVALSRVERSFGARDWNCIRSVPRISPADLHARRRG